MDAVELVRGPEREDAMFRCNDCGTLQTHLELLPTGGSPCVACSNPIHVSDRVEFAGLRTRLVSAGIDALVWVIPLTMVLWFLFIFVILSGLFPQDENGEFTSGAQRATFAMVAGAVIAYFWLVEISGLSVGRALTGLSVVRSDSWKRPGIVRGTFRFAGKILTIASLGTGFLPIPFDAQRRSLHDIIAGTRVVQR